VEEEVNLVLARALIYRFHLSTTTTTTTTTNATTALIIIATKAKEVTDS